MIQMMMKAIKIRKEKAGIHKTERFSATNVLATFRSIIPILIFSLELKAIQIIITATITKKPPAPYPSFVPKKIIATTMASEIWKNISDHIITSVHFGVNQTSKHLIILNRDLKKKKNLLQNIHITPG